VGHVVFSGGDFRVYVSIAGSGPLIPLDPVLSINWSEKKTKNVDKDQITGVISLARYEDHPIFSFFEPLCGAKTIGQLPTFDLHLIGMNPKANQGICTVLLDLNLNRIQDGISAQDMGGEVVAHFTAEGVSHWHQI
jgi:hypothetical protein